ncbi:MAG: hypothetical protein HFG42_01705 [Lachnospiraceae bacterium]|nr:hypothetical protein [Lachnospiraceae bacterium]
MTQEEMQILSQMLDQKLEEKLEEKLDQKLNEKLAPIQADISELKLDVAELKQDVAGLKNTTATLALDMENLKEAVSQIRLEIENTLIPTIKLLAENYVPAATRYEKTAAELYTLKTEHNMMKLTIERHSNLIQRLIKKLGYSNDIAFLLNPV